MSAAGMISRSPLEDSVTAPQWDRPTLQPAGSSQGFRCRQSLWHALSARCAPSLAVLMTPLSGTEGTVPCRSFVGFRWPCSTKLLPHLMPQGTAGNCYPPVPISTAIVHARCCIARQHCVCLDKTGSDIPCHVLGCRWQRTSSSAEHLPGARDLHCRGSTT